MLNRKIKKIGTSMLTLAALTMGGQTVFAASQENIQVAQEGKTTVTFADKDAIANKLVKDGVIIRNYGDNSNSEITMARTTNDEEFIKYIKELITKDTKIIDKASGKMVNASDADLTNKETLDEIIEALIKEGQIVKADAAQGIEAGTTEARAINDEDFIKYIKELITKDTKIFDKTSGKMINASDADLTNKETLNAVIEVLIKDGKIAKAVEIQKTENGDIKK
ncbi:hypothetical protein [Clostridium beijerinckii]|uniref:hypothetical protein n=1 Tax=Clostridium beijerinckii TaxID=1520 RepID=UPI00156E03BE|nr:hypothetical protein [Clostridium beijerinckii]NRT75315.1 flagellar biosynthesis chaperone FliJ [Clostridium beijerinckii]